MTDPGGPGDTSGSHDTVYIISDLHLGNAHARVPLFRRFLAALPPAATLVLNGDTIDAPGRPLPPEHADALQALYAAAQQRRVIWITGNHDDDFTLPADSGIERYDTWRLDDRLVVAHGHVFERSMDRHRWFIDAFEWLHALRQRLGAQPVHVAQIAKRIRPLFAYLCREQRINAVRFAREQQVPAITCGHVHQSEDRPHEGVRYINTGCWTDPDTHCLVCTPHALTLHPVPHLITTWTTQEEQTN